MFTYHQLLKSRSGLQEWNRKHAFLFSATDILGRLQQMEFHFGPIILVGWWLLCYLTNSYVIAYVNGSWYVLSS